MSEAAQHPAPELKAQELQRAFDAFNRVSVELTQAYEALHGRVESLTAELAVANGELRRQYQEKEALSERLSLLLGALPAGVVVLDGAALVSEANPAARRMLGETVVGSDWRVVAGERLVATDAPDEWQLDGRRLAIAESDLAWMEARGPFALRQPRAHVRALAAPHASRAARLCEPAHERLLQDLLLRRTTFYTALEEGEETAVILDPGRNHRRRGRTQSVRTALEAIHRGEDTPAVSDGGPRGDVVWPLAEVAIAQPDRDTIPEGESRGSVIPLLSPGLRPTSRKPCPRCARPQGHACGALRAALSAGLRSPRAPTGPCWTATTTKGESR